MEPRKTPNFRPAPPRGSVRAQHEHDQAATDPRRRRTRGDAPPQQPTGDPLPGPAPRRARRVR